MYQKPKTIVISTGAERNGEIYTLTVNFLDFSTPLRFAQNDVTIYILIHPPFVQLVQSY